LSASRKRRSLLREVNEQIRNVNAGFGIQESTLLILCECERPECLERIEVPTVLYDKLREDGERFVVLGGHEDSDVERVTASPDGYSIVRDARGGLKVVEADDRPVRLPAA
jgi:hypothetical protein